MTREEAIQTIKYLKLDAKDYGLENKFMQEVVQAFDVAIEALEQKPICPSAGVDCEDCPAYEKKSECEHDHEVLKAYSDGASAVLDNVRAEIESLKPCQGCFYDGITRCLEIIDKYAEEDKA